MNPHRKNHETLENLKNHGKPYNPVKLNPLENHKNPRKPLDSIRLCKTLKKPQKTQRYFLLKSSVLRCSTCCRSTVHFTAGTMRVSTLMLRFSCSNALKAKSNSPSHSNDLDITPQKNRDYRLKRFLDFTPLLSPFTTIVLSLDIRFTCP